MSDERENAKPNEEIIECSANCAQTQIDKTIQALDELSRHFVSLPVLDTRSIDEIIGYDEFGVPK